MAEGGCGGPPNAPNPNNPNEITVNVNGFVVLYHENEEQQQQLALPDGGAYGNDPNPAYQVQTPGSVAGSDPNSSYQSAVSNLNSTGSCSFRTASEFNDSQAYYDGDNNAVPAANPPGPSRLEQQGNQMGLNRTPPPLPPGDNFYAGLNSTWPPATAAPAGTNGGGGNGNNSFCPMARSPLEQQGNQMGLSRSPPPLPPADNFNAGLNSTWPPATAAPARTAGGGGNNSFCPMARSPSRLEQQVNQMGIYRLPPADNFDAGLNSTWPPATAAPGATGGGGANNSFCPMMASSPLEQQGNQLGINRTPPPLPPGDNFYAGLNSTWPPATAAPALTGSRGNCPLARGASQTGFPAPARQMGMERTPPPCQRVGPMRPQAPSPPAAPQVPRGIYPMPRTSPEIPPPPRQIPVTPPPDNRRMVAAGGCVRSGVERSPGLADGRPTARIGPSNMRMIGPLAFDDWMAREQPDDLPAITVDHIQMYMQQLNQSLDAMARMTESVQDQYVRPDIDRYRDEIIARIRAAQQNRPVQIQRSPPRFPPPSPLGPNTYGPPSLWQYTEQVIPGLPADQQLEYRRTLSRVTDAERRYPNLTSPHQRMALRDHIEPGREEVMRNLRNAGFLPNLAPPPPPPAAAAQPIPGPSRLAQGQAVGVRMSANPGVGTAQGQVVGPPPPAQAQQPCPRMVPAQGYINPSFVPETPPCSPQGAAADNSYVPNSPPPMPATPPQVQGAPACFSQLLRDAHGFITGQMQRTP